MHPKSLFYALNLLHIIIKNQQKYSFLDLAMRLDVTEKTLYNWLKYPEKHPMPLGKFLLLSEILGVSPVRMFGANTRVFPRLDDPVGAEKQLLELERELSPGETKKIVYPLFSPPLMLDPLVKLYSAKGLYKRFFPGVDLLDSEKEESSVVKQRFNEFLELRRQRRKLFEDSNYIIELVFMRNEFEAWVNGERLFKYLSIEKEDPSYIEGDDKGNRLKCLSKQIDYFLDLLSQTTWNGYPRLSLRMITSVLRMQYTLFNGISRNQDYPLALISSNTGLIFTEDLEVVNFLKKEFSGIWDNENIIFPELKKPDEWKAFLKMLKGYVEYNLQDEEPNKFSVRSSLKNLGAFL